jgi:hypothetical protein
MEGQDSIENQQFLSNMSPEQLMCYQLQQQAQAQLTM